ncbi:MAG: ABC transporter substrate-binding protein [Sporichthyaceae bacterium]
MKHRLVPVVLTVASLVVLSACGSRVGGEEVLAGAGGGTVRLDEASIAELGRVSAGSAPAAAAAEVAAPADVGPATAPGTSTGAAKPKTGAPGTSAAGAEAAAKPSRTTATGATGSTAKKAGGLSAAVPTRCTGPGAPIKIGQVGAFSGVAGPITANARTALAAWVQDVNARGGIACHPVQLFAVDTGADPARASSVVSQLVNEKGVVALVAAFDAIGFKGIQSSAERLRVPVVGGDGIDFGWTESPYLYPTGAGILGSIRGALRQTVGSGKKNLGLLYCVEASACTSGAKIIPSEAERAGGKVTYSAAISLTQPDFTAQCQAAKSAGVEAMGVSMDGASIARVARSCASISFHPQFVTNGLVLSAQNAEDPNIRKNTLSSASAVAPWMTANQDTPGQRAYHAALAKYAPNSEPTANSITAWAAGRLFESVIANLGPSAAAKPITTADVITGLGKVSKETLDGLVPPLTFKPGQKFSPQIECVYFTLLSDKGWTAVNGSKPTC